jgi:ABC-type taurine transport system substrate-binding protein
VQLGDVPEWVQAAAEAGALYLAVRGRWQQQAVDWAKELERLSGMGTKELRQAVEAAPHLQSW